LGSDYTRRFYRAFGHINWRGEPLPVYLHNNDADLLHLRVTNLECLSDPTSDHYIRDYAPLFERLFNMTHQEDEAMGFGFGTGDDTTGPGTPQTAQQAATGLLGTGPYTGAHTPVGPPIPPQTTSQMIQLLVQQQGQLSQSIAALTTAIGTQQARPVHVTTGAHNNAFQKPADFKGDSTMDARRFLAQFRLFATNSGTMLNTLDANGLLVRDDGLWVRSALSFLKEKAGQWATPFLEKLAQGHSPFADWNTFETEFKKRFDSADPVSEALLVCDTIRQGSGTTAELAAKFKPYWTTLAAAGHSDKDGWQKFYHALPPAIQDYITLYCTKPKSTLDQLMTAATEYNNLHLMRAAERKVMATGQYVPRQTIFQRPSAPARDPNAMDVDATRVASPSVQAHLQDFLGSVAASGRCFCCGDRGHIKPNCPRGGSAKCSWCNRTGHLEVVCRSKAQGRPKFAPGMRVAATVDPTPQVQPAESPVSSAQYLEMMALQKQNQDAIAQLTVAMTRMMEGSNF
jgi:hypothetical protein